MQIVEVSRETFQAESVSALYFKLDVMELRYVVFLAQAQICTVVSTVDIIRHPHPSQLIKLKIKLKFLIKYNIGMANFMCAFKIIDN